MTLDQTTSSETTNNKEILPGIQAVILDMDGLMIDSEPFHLKAYNNVLGQFGVTLTEEENTERYVGIGDKAQAEDLIIRFQLSITLEELLTQKQAAYKGFLKSEVKPQLGLLELLNNLKSAGYRIAIASGSFLSDIEAVMDSLKIRDFINAYCSVEQVGKGKPAPDILLFTAEKLSISPTRCLYLGDAPSDSQAASAIGMPNFIIPSRETKTKNFVGANRKLQSLNEVFRYLSHKIV
ncbi:MAG: HAD family phosphatase [Patescibacteria group bacterium]